MFKLKNKMNEIVKLFQSIWWSYEGILNVFFLLLLIMFIFAIIGCYVLGDIHYTDYKDIFSAASDINNFEDFYKAFMVLFIISCDSYIDFTFDYMNARTDPVDKFFVAVYFIACFFFCFLLMLNLFLLIIIMQYDDFYQKKQNPLEKFERISNVFIKVWSEFVEDDDNLMSIKNIKVKKFLELLEKHQDIKNFTLDEQREIKDDDILPKEELGVKSTKLYIFDLRLLE